MTLRELARFVEVDHSTLWLIEHDRIANPKPALQVRIARALRVPLDRVIRVACSTG